MSRIDVTLIDVGHGDCIFLESVDCDGNRSYGLIDCPDSTTLQPGLLYIKRVFDRHHNGPGKRGVMATWRKPDMRISPMFSFVLMTHAHKDHCLGLHRIIKTFGTTSFVYGRHASRGPAGHVFKYAKSRLGLGAMHQVDSTVPFPCPTLGAATIAVLYPDASSPASNENDNSVVLAIELDQICIVLTGDVETGCWSAIALPHTTKVLKAPHHGAESGTLTPAGVSPWIPLLTNLNIGVSCHPVPFGHPHNPSVLAMTSAGHNVYRTDKHGDITFTIESGVLSVRCHQ